MSKPAREWRETRVPCGANVRVVQECTCTLCQRFLPATTEYFYRHRQKLMSWCKECFAAYYKARKPKSRREPSSKRFRMNGAVEEARCASCENWLPATRANFYLQRNSAGELRPHSWCKPCYLSNSGRGAGMKPSKTEEKPEAIRIERNAQAAQYAFISRVSPGNLPAELIGWTL